MRIADPGSKKYYAQQSCLYFLWIPGQSRDDSYKFASTFCICSSIDWRMASSRTSSNTPAMKAWMRSSRACALGMPRLNVGKTKLWHPTGRWWHHGNISHHRQKFPVQVWNYFRHYRPATRLGLTGNHRFFAHRASLQSGPGTRLCPARQSRLSPFAG